jgi:hypothetical protein
MKNNTEKKVLGVIIVVMIVILLCLCAALAAGVRRAGRENPSASFVDFLSLKRAHGPLPAADADLIRPWMTFDYVNRLFGLPPEYLKVGLDITDKRYPDISFTEYSESSGTTSVSFLGSVRSAVLDSTSTLR